MDHALIRGSVLLAYGQYEQMYQELQLYRELSWQEEIGKRVVELKNDPEQLIPLRKAVGEEDYARISAIDQKLYGF